MDKATELGVARPNENSMHEVASAPFMETQAQMSTRVSARQLLQRVKRVSSARSEVLPFFTVADDEAYGENEAQVREASPVLVPHPVPGQPKRKMNLHLSLDKLEKPVLPMMMVQPEEPKTDCGPRRKSVLFDDDSLDGQSSAVSATNSARPPTVRQRRASSVTLSMNSPEAAEFIEVAHDGPQELGKRTKRVKKLGKGAGGTVFLSLYLPTLKLVAVKEVVVYQEEDRHMVKRELHALHDNLASIDADAPLSGSGGFSSSDMLKHHFLSGLKSRNSLCPYLVTFYGAFLKPAKCAVSVVMEFMDMGSVQDLLDANITVSEDVLRHAAFCCITALDHMHSQRMVHRDVKPANILMNRNGEFKVADFGLAGTLAKSNSFFSDFTGTMMYMAPERISGAQYTCVSDVWSLGITLFSLATGAYPFTVDDGFFGLEEAICHDTLPPMPNRFSPVCRDFIKRMLNRDPDRRLSSEAALTHPFISGYANSTAFRNFSQVWHSLEIKRAIDPEDARTIVNLAVEYSYRYPSMVNLPPEVTGAESATNISLSSQGPPEKHSFFHRFSKFLGQAPPNSNIAPRGPIERLADECRVSTEHLLELFHEALN